MAVAQTHKMEQWLGQMEELFKACADQTRIRILNLLAREGEICVCHLVDVFQTNQPKVSRHLAYLKRAGLVTDRKDGLWVHYRLAEPLAEHTGRLLSCLASCCLEVPEMQRDVLSLQMARGAQPLVKLTSRQPQVMQGKEEEQKSVPDTPETQPQIQIELL